MHPNLRPNIILTALFCICFAAILPAQAPNITCPPGTITISDETNNDDNYWNANWWWDAVIDSHNLAESGSEALEITATDQCSASGNLHFRYILSLDLNQDQTYDTYIDSDDLPASNTVYVGNSPTSLFSGTARQFDTRAVNANEKWGFGISVVPDGNNRKAQVVWKNDAGNIIPAEIPYGAHHIQWFVTDSCGATTECAYNVAVKDGGKPTVTCVNGLTVLLNNIQGGFAQLWNADFFQSGNDNYTPIGELELGLRRVGSGTGFPYKLDSTIQTGVVYNCCEIGAQSVELWVKDKQGNTGFCTTYVFIQDNMGVCNCYQDIYQGLIYREDRKAIADAGLILTSNSNGVPSLTLSSQSDTSGYYAYYYYGYTFPSGLYNTLTPTLAQDPLNGVNAWDLVLISRHILGLSAITSPYKLIAADVNHSGTVTTYDVVELRRLLLGTYTELPVHYSWRFIRESQVFTDPLNPFADSLQESALIPEYNNFYWQNFIGCKYGDIDYSAVPHFVGNSTEDRNKELVFITLQDKMVTAGEQVRVHFETPGSMEAVQMTISANGLLPDHIESIAGGTMDNFVVFPNVITAVLEQQGTFDVIFTAQKSGKLSQMLYLSDDITPTMAFSATGKQQSVALRFTDNTSPSLLPVLFEAAPNPWREATQIDFYLPEPGDVRFSVIDQNGALVKMISGRFEAGSQQVRFSKSDFPCAGMYYVRMNAGDFVEVKKLVLVK